jgi:hypothetical protein
MGRCHSLQPRRRRRLPRRLQMRCTERASLQSHKARNWGTTPEMMEAVNYYQKRLEEWLGGRDSNPDKQSQSLLSYR